MCNEREGILRETRSVVQNSLYRRRSKRFAEIAKEGCHGRLGKNKRFRLFVFTKQSI